MNVSFDIKPLSVELLEQYLHFFDHIQFEENPDRHKCYCIDYHFLGDVESCTREQSRSSVIELIKAKKLRGYLAFDGDIPVGWCNANERSNYQRLLRDYDYVDNPADKVVSIVCFLILPEYRRKGIARLLLERVITDHSDSDFDFFEAYPKKEADSNEGNFNGPLALYEKNDFTIHREYADCYALRKRMK